MYKIYLKQAWALIRQERLFSSVYIVGTGLAISLVMVLSIVFYVKMASIYPEMDRDRLLTVKSAALKNEKGGTSSGPVSPRFVEECLAGVPGLEALALCCDDAASAFVQPVGSPVQIPVMKMGVNDGFWKVFSFRFLEGKPFTEADFRSGMPVAVIARSLAKRLYGDGNAVGQTLSLDFMPVRVVGVVDDVSYLMNRVYSQLWLPYTLMPDLEERFRSAEARMPGLGPLKVYMLVKDKADIGKVREAVADNVRRFNQSLNVDGKREFSLLGQPDRHWESIFRYWSNVEPDIVGDLSRYGVIFLLLLLVPAVSLSGMADSRMERRLGELGVRRAFGAAQGGVDRAGLDGELPVYAAGRLGGTPVLLPVGDVRQFVGLQDRQGVFGCRPGWRGRIALHGDAVQPVGLLDRLVRMFPVKPDVGVVARLACVKATYR